MSDPKLKPNIDECAMCNGSGDCQSCDGTGLDGGVIGASPCDWCAGTAACPDCNGSGICSTDEEPNDDRR